MTSTRAGAKLFARYVVPAASATFASTWQPSSSNNTTTFCDGATNRRPSPSDSSSATGAFQAYTGMKQEEMGDFYGLFPKRQLWQPKVE
jgi:hypothetical protein